MEKLTDKVVLIVGATGGIGAAAAKHLHKSGATVYITSRYVNKLQILSAELGINESRCFILDFESQESITSVVSNILAQESKIDILINAAGVGIIKNFEQLTVEDMRKSIQINLLGPFMVLQAVLNSMKEQKKGFLQTMFAK